MALKKKAQVRSEDAGQYVVMPPGVLGPLPMAPAQPAVPVPKFILWTDDELITAAIAVLGTRIRHSDVITSPKDTRTFLRLQFSGLEHEVFACLWLDNQHKVIEVEEMFRGTVDGASVYPREVVKSALKHNAAAVIFAHNHPSGQEQPSDADKHITSRLRTALNTVDIRVLDHLVVGDLEVYSFAEHGLI